MILQALKDYYDRKAADSDSGIAPEGWKWEKIPFIVVLDEKGSLLQIEDTREGDGRKKYGKSFLVPLGEKKANGIKANLLWDTANYVFGIVNTEGLSEDKKKRSLSRLPEQKKVFIERVKNEITDSPRKTALLAFLSHVDRQMLEKMPHWEDIFHTNSNISFRFESEHRLYCETEEIKKTLTEKFGSKEANGLCMVTGERDKISTLHTVIKGVRGTQQSLGMIVAFNNHAFCSYGKRNMQGLNAPVGETAMFAYTTALNSLLARDSTQRLHVGEAATVVFWSAEKTRFEADFAQFFAEPPKDDPDMGTRCIKDLLESPNTGAYIEDSGDTKFFVLGLSPNVARISINFWRRGTVAEFAGNIRQHFEDIEIVKPKNEPPYYSLWRLLVNTAVQDKSENIPPNIAGDFMRSILDNTSYPATLLQAVLRRIRSDTEHRVKPVRAALIKAYLNRRIRAHKLNEKELTVGLDKEQTSQAYHLGRLFAVLEKIQEEANPGLNATIRERYYGAACGSPVTVFPTLMRLKNHHLAKLEYKGRAVNLESLISEIVGHFDDFPARLDLYEQGKFAVGYYHQRQDLFTSKKEGKDSLPEGEKVEGDSTQSSLS
ncbi:MAG: type I-C CRISPR-associated protein Cas8c/Csd1 [Treponema sp.]|jgi:CRISPR-associated protein Csd1|nr:type I-C CRISPR-associated protein Cas8c/Csd1 [Treponema sp.]